MAVDIRLLKSKLKYHERTYRDVAMAIGINHDTFTRRMKDGGSFRVSEVQAMMDFVPLTEEDVRDIFFARGDGA